MITNKSLSGPNKRLFQLSIAGKNWVACLPRPNYSLDDPVYFGENLVKLCHHHFTCFCAYRCLTKHIPKAAMYKFDLSVSHDHLKEYSPYEYEWAFILLEDLTLDNVDAHEALKVARELFEVDVLLGHWECVVGKNQQDLASSRYAMYGTTTGTLSMVYKKLVIFLPRLCFLIFAKIHLGLFLNLLKIIRRFLNFFLKNTLLMIFFLSREEKCLKYFLIEYKSLGRFLRLKNLGLCVSYKGVSYKPYWVYS